MAKFPGATQYPVRWWGFPTVHAARRIKPVVLLVIHETGNPNLPSATGEATYSNRDGSGASFTFCNNRDGSSVQCLDPVTQVPWTNGDVKEPTARVKALLEKYPGYNFNELCFMTAENVAYLDRDPITAKQKETLAQEAAWGSKVSGLPVNRDTVLGHRNINTVTRWNCPVPGDLGKFLDGIIARANEILQEEDPEVIADLKAQLADMTQKRDTWRERAKTRRDEIDSLEAEIDKLNADLESAVLSPEDADHLRHRINHLIDRIHIIKDKVAALAVDVGDE